MFQRLVTPTFTARKGQKLKLIKEIQLYLRKSRYETKRVVAALKEAFTENLDLFRSRQDSIWRLKVAVTATSGTGA